MVDLTIIKKHIEARRFCNALENELEKDLDTMKETKMTFFRYQGLDSIRSIKQNSITNFRKALKKGCIHTDFSKDGEESIYLQYEEPISLRSEHVKCYEYCLACGMSTGVGVYPAGTYVSESKIFNINPYLEFTSLELFQESLKRVITLIEDTVIELEKNKDEVEYIVLMAILKQKLDEAQNQRLTR